MALSAGGKSTGTSKALPKKENRTTPGSKRAQFSFSALVTVKLSLGSPDKVWNLQHSPKTSKSAEPSAGQAAGWLGSEEIFMPWVPNSDCSLWAYARQLPRGHGSPAARGPAAASTVTPHKCWAPPQFLWSPCPTLPDWGLCHSSPRFAKFRWCLLKS